MTACAGGGLSGTVREAAGMPRGTKQRLPLPVEPLPRSDVYGTTLVSPKAAVASDAGSRLLTAMPSSIDDGSATVAIPA